jgi:hypothetical protein
MMPSPASFPSVLSCSGHSLVDSNGYVLPPMKGINVNPTSKGDGLVPVSSDYQAMAAKGINYVRAEIWWSHLQPNEPGGSIGNGISSSYISDLDALVTNCLDNGLYVWFNFIGETSDTIPSWAQQLTPEGSLQNYVAAYPLGAQTAVQYLASRYGNSSGVLGADDYPVVMGFGINEPTPDDTSQNNWVTTMVGEQVTLIDWVRASGYAPQWIVSISAGASSGCAMLHNASGSGQTAQTFTDASTSPATNFMLEVHDPVKVPTTDTSVPGFPVNDGRNPTYGGLGSTVVQIGDTTYRGYPPNISGITRSDMQAMMAAWWANYEDYAQQADCPIFLAEGNWDPVVNNSGPGGADGAAYITDKLALWYSLNPVPAMMSIWEYNTDQSTDDFAMRPGTTPGTGGGPNGEIVGGTPDGWTFYADAFFSSSAALFRILQESGTWYRLE